MQTIALCHILSDIMSSKFGNYYTRQSVTKMAGAGTNYMDDNSGGSTVLSITLCRIDALIIIDYYMATCHHIFQIGAK